MLASRFPCAYHVMAGGRYTHDRAHGVGGQGWDGSVLRRPAWYPTGDRRHRGGKDGLPHQPAQGTPPEGLVSLIEVKRCITLADYKAVTSTIWGPCVCVCADGPSLSSLHLILQLGQTLLQGVRCFPLGECPHLSDFVTHSLLQLTNLDKKYMVFIIP